MFQALWDLAERLGEVRGRGMTEEEINKLPSRTYKHGTDERCSICLCDFSCGDKLSLLPCSHEEHSECLVEWLKVSGNAVKHTCTDQNKTNPLWTRKTTKPLWTRKNKPALDQKKTNPLWTRKYQPPSGPENPQIPLDQKYKQTPSGPETNKPPWTRNNQTPSGPEKNKHL